MADGSIRIETVIDNKAAKRELANLEKMLAETEKKQEDLYKSDRSEQLRSETEYAKQVRDTAIKNAKSQEQINLAQREYEKTLQQIAIRYDDVVSKANQYAEQIKETRHNISVVKEHIDNLNKAQQGTTSETKKTEKAEKNVNAQAKKVKKSLDNSQKATQKMSRGFANAWQGAKKLGSAVGAKFVKGIKSAATHLKSMVHHADGLRGKFLKVGLALVGIRGLMGGLRQLVREALSSNEGLQNQITAIKGVLATALAPAINIVSQALQKLISFVDALYTRMTGVSLIAKYNAQQQEKATKEAEKQAKNEKKTTKQKEKQLAAFDKINKLSEDKDDTSKDNDTNANVTTTAALPKFETSQLSSWAKDLISKIKKSLSTGDFTSVGKTLAGKIVAGLKKIPWKTIKQKAFGAGKSFATFLNGIFEYKDKDGKSLSQHLGKALGEALNTAIYAGLGFVENFKWRTAGKELGKGFNTWVDTVEWDKLGKLIGDSIKGLLEGLDEFIKTVDGKKVGEALGKVIKNIDWGGIIIDLMYVVTDAIKLFFDTVTGLFDELGKNPKDIRNKTSKFFNDLKTWAKTSLIPMLESWVKALVSIIKNTSSIKGAIFLGIYDALFDGSSTHGTGKKEHGGGGGKFNEIKVPISVKFSQTVNWIKREWRKRIRPIANKFVEFGAKFTQKVSEIKKAWDKRKKEITSKWANFWAKFTQTVTQIRQSWQKRRAAITEKWANFWAKFKQTPQQIAEAWKKRRDKIKEKTVNFKAKFTQTASDIGNAWKKRKDKITGKIVEFGATFKDAVTGALNNLIARINNLIAKLWNIKIGTFYPFGGIDQIPYLARGGIVPAVQGGTVAVLGEGKSDEAVLPLNDATLGRLASMLNSYGGNGQIVVPIYLDSQLIANKVIEKNQQRNFRQNRGGAYV